ncbi:hypothetical protein K0M31_019443 [Melipona bicolor]|uniref:Uncharacterized protein n=1 Tax=Melipona bicolor TaxID=60889 RepID=A0AA40G2S0_9HYME|nr:hypothetical protein K0M31_019443 [Melipona bicolor]
MSPINNKRTQISTYETTCLSNVTAVLTQFESCARHSRPLPDWSIGNGKCHWSIEKVFGVALREQSGRTTEQTRIRVGSSKVAVAAPIFSSDSNCNEGISGNYRGSGSDDGGG